MSQAPNVEQRIYWIDIMRGIAILLMIPANMAPYMADPHPIWYRLMGSFAAPIFIMLSAGMVTLRADKHNFSYYLHRAFYVILCGVFLDLVLWQILPFTSFDVLYTIGFGMLLVYLLRNVDVRELILLAIIIFLASYALLQILGYHAEALEIYFLEDASLPEFGRLAQSWFIDGWFPIFPWIGFALLGAAFFKYFQGSSEPIPAQKLLIWGGALLVIGCVMLFAPIPHYENFASEQIIANRGGYSEIFYPATPAYIITSLGVFLVVLRIVYHSRPNAIGDVISFFGKYSMLAYLVHQILGVVLIGPVLNVLGVDHIYIGWFFTFANIVVVGGVYIICLFAGFFKEYYPVKSIFLQVLIGK